MLRAYHPFEVAPDAPTLTLSREESFHIVKVLRARADEKISAFDGRGNVWTGRMVSADAKALEIAVETRKRAAPPPCRLALAQMLPKGSLADDIVRAGVEIGLSEFYPIFCRRGFWRLYFAPFKRLPCFCFRFSVRTFCFTVQWERFVR